MQWTIFAVGDEPYCLWELDVAERTRDFLSGLDTEFFTYVLGAYLATEDEKRMSVGIRLTLHHAIETLFSLLGAFVQAPDTPYAWIGRCRTDELRSVVKRISAGDISLISKWNFAVTGWEPVAAAVLQTFEPGTDRQQQTVQGFARLWGRLASELLSDVVNDEYNAIKHGFRTRAGGFKLEIGKQEAPDIPAPPEEMRTLGESKFGSMFYKIEKLEGRGGRHIRSRRAATNWSLERDMLLLQLVQNSIANVVSGLKVTNGFPPGDCKFVRPSLDEDFERPWSHSPGVTAMNIDFSFDSSRLPQLTKSELLERMRVAAREQPS